MRLSVIADDRGYDEFIGAIKTSIEINRITESDSHKVDPETVLFILDENFDKGKITSLNASHIFINDVLQTNRELTLDSSSSRINAWPGFLRREMWEIVSEDTKHVSSIIDLLGKKVHFAHDLPGMIAPRIIAMIVNEAYFALSEDVSSKAEIDTAMKLGTNYPFGPFEWSKMIGIEKIASLLKRLSTSDTRYTPSPFLLKEMEQPDELEKL